MKMPINNYFMQKKIKHPSTPSIKHNNLFRYYIVLSEINQNIAVEGLNCGHVCHSLGHVFIVLMSVKSNDITNIFVKSILVQKIA